MPPDDRGSRLEWLFGVVLPSVVLGPFIVFGLLGSFITLLTRSSRLEAASLEVMGVLVGLALVGALGLLALGTVLRRGSAAIRAQPVLRAFVFVALLALVLGGLYALYAQAPSLVWSFRDPKNRLGLLFQIPAVVLLLGPVLVASRYLYRLAGPSKGRVTAHTGQGSG
jgi:hypothetical protein